jgi:glutaredoxin 3
VSRAAIMKGKKSSMPQEATPQAPPCEPRPDEPKPLVTIYTTPTCPYCLKAKRLLTAKTITFKEIDVASSWELRDEMTQRAKGRYTVPQIFIGDRGVGGCDELHELERSGKLDALLASR